MPRTTMVALASAVEEAAAAAVAVAAVWAAAVAAGLESAAVAVSEAAVPVEASRNDAFGDPQIWAVA